MVLPTCDRAILSYSSASAWASLHGFPKCFRGELHHVVWVCDVRATCGGLSCFARILAIKTTVWRVLRSKRNIHITLISPCSSIVLAKKLFGASKCHNWFSIPVVTIRWQYATKNKINFSRALSVLQVIFAFLKVYFQLKDKILESKHEFCIIFSSAHCPWSVKCARKTISALHNWKWN